MSIKYDEWEASQQDLYAYVVGKLADRLGPKVLESDGASITLFDRNGIEAYGTPAYDRFPLTVHYMTAQALRAACSQLDQRSVQRDAKLLAQLAQFEKDDVSRSGKLGGKGLGVWRVHQRLDINSTQVEDLRDQEAELFRRLLSREEQYKLPKLVIYASCPFSHEVAQKVFELGTVTQKTGLARNVEYNVKLLSQSQFGCLFLQQMLCSACTLLEDSKANKYPLTPDDVIFIQTVVSAFRKHLLTPQGLLESSTHQHGNHVVQRWVRLLQLLPDLGSQETHLLPQLQEEVGKNAVVIGQSQFGNRVLIRLCEGRTTVSFMQKLTEWSTLEQLIPNEMGNYVVKSMLDHGSPEMTLLVLNHIHDNFTRGQYLYAMHNFARHVVQKCFEVQVEWLPELQQSRASMLNLVLLPDGQVRPSYAYLCLDPCAQHVLEAMQKCQRARRGSSAKFRPRPRGNGWHRGSPGHHRQ